MPSNTHKHHTRNPPTSPTARIGDVEQSGGRWRVTVELDWLSRPDGPTVDALDLADQCVAEWRRIFQLNGIAEPSRLTRDNADVPHRPDALMDDVNPFRGNFRE